MTVFVAGATGVLGLPVRCGKSIQGMRVLCGAAVIVVEQAAQAISPLDQTIPRHRPCQRHRTLLINALMRSGMVVVVSIGRQHPAQMPLPKDQDPVEALRAHRPNPAFSERVCIRCPEWGTDDRQVLRGKHGIESRRELGVTIMDQEACWHVSLLDLPAELTGLLRYPGTRRACGATS